MELFKQIDKKYIIGGLVFIFVIVPVFLFGIEGNNGGVVIDSSTENLLKYIKGDGAFESWFMDVFRKLDENLENMAETSSLLGRAIGGIGALLSFGYLGWQMQSGDRDWEIMPILKPLFVGLILFNWVSFYNLIQTPFLKLAEPSEAVFKEIEEEANNLRILRFEKQKALVEYLIAQEAEQEIAEAKESWVPGSETIAEMTMAIKKWNLSMKFDIQKTIGEWMEAVALGILRIMVYSIFFIQKIWSYVLIVLGPVAVGFTLIPGFQSSLTSWVSKFINVNLFTFILFTIIDIGQILIISAYQMEIDRLSVFVGDDGLVKEQSINLIRQFLENSGMIYSVLFTVVAYVITGIGAWMTPTIADSIVSAGGAITMSKMKSAAMKTAGAASIVSKHSSNVSMSTIKGGVKGGKFIASRIKRGKN